MLHTLTLALRQELLESTYAIDIINITCILILSSHSRPLFCGHVVIRVRIINTVAGVVVGKVIVIVTIAVAVLLINHWLPASASTSS